jgi:hypothetical protein
LVFIQDKDGPRGGYLWDSTGPFLAPAYIFKPLESVGYQESADNPSNLRNKDGLFGSPFRTDDWPRKKP